MNSLLLASLQVLLPMPLGALLVPTPATAPHPDADLAARCARVVAPWIDRGFFPGVAVGVAVGDEVWVAGFGETAPGSGVRPDARTLYEIGSLTKLYAGLLLADSHLRGVARLEDTLQEHLPEGVQVPVFEGAPIRLVHLSTHSSGLSRLPSNLKATARDPYAHYDAAALYAGLGAARPQRAPGARYEYSNFAVGALGHALALANGVRSFEELCIARIAVTHGFDDTRLSLTDEQQARLAPACDASLELSESWHFDALAAAGGLRASAQDLLGFGRLFIDGATHAHVAGCALTKVEHARAPGGPPMGLGWHFARLAPSEPELLVHEGQTGGYHSLLAVEPKGGVVVAILCNAPCATIGALGHDVLRAAWGQEVTPADFAPLLATESRALAELPGKYTVKLFDSVEITAAGGALFARRSGQARVRLNRVAEDRYEYRVVPGALQVLRAEGGAVRALALSLGDDTVEARRR